MPGGNGYGKLEGYPLREKLFVSKCRTKVSNYVGISDGEVCSSVGSSGVVGYGDLESYLLRGKSLGADSGSDKGSYNGRSYGSGYGKLQG